MKKHFVHLAFLLVTPALLLLSTLASAQPSAGISKSPPLVGTGAVGNPLRIDPCPAGQVYISTGSTWMCSSPGATYTAGDGLTLTGTDFDVGATIGGGITVGADSIGLLTSCSSDQVLRWNGSAWACSAVNLGATTTCPSGTVIMSVTAAGSAGCSAPSGIDTLGPDGDKGDATIGGSGATITVDANAIGLTKLADIATARILGRVTAGTGDPEELTGTQATTLLDPFTTTLKGLVPPSGGGTSNFLRADGAWAPPPGGTIDGTGSASTMAAWSDTDTLTHSIATTHTLASSSATASATALSANATGTYNTSGGSLNSVGTWSTASTTRATGANSLNNYGSRSSASNGQNNYGLRSDGTSASGTSAWGGYFAATGAGTNTAVRAEASGGATNIALSLSGALQANGDLGSDGEVLTIASGVPTWAAAPTDTLGPDGDKGDVSVGGTGTTLTIDNDAVTLAKMANLTGPVLIGRTTGTGDPQSLSATPVTAMLNVFTDALKGLAPASGGGTTNFLRADGTWAPPPGSNALVTANVLPKGDGSTQVASSITDNGSTVSITATNVEVNNLQISNGSPNKISLKAGGVSLSSCGTSPTVNGNRTGGRIVTGTGASACTVSFTNSYSNAPVCVVSAENKASNLAYSTGMGALTLSSATASAAYHYICADTY
jgi:hypothetical protein